MTLFATEPPLGEPLTLAEAKAHLRLETDAEDALVASLIAAARGHLEAVTGLVLTSQAFRLLLDDWPADGVIRIERFPVQAIDGVTVYDADGVPAAVGFDGAALDGRARPARLILADTPRPGAVLNGIEIDLTAGFGTAADVPPELRRALLLHVAHMYEFRGAVSPDMQPAGLPHGYHTLVAPWTRRRL